MSQIFMFRLFTCKSDFGVHHGWPERDEKSFNDKPSMVLCKEVGGNVQALALQASFNNLKCKFAHFKCKF